MTWGIFCLTNAIFSSPAKPDGHQKWVDFVTSFWHCECICLMSETVFIERYHKWCKRYDYRFTKQKAADVYAASLGHITTLPKNANTKLLVTQAAAQLTAISRTVEVYRMELLRLAEMLPEYPVVMGIYGVGVVTGPQLMAEIGDVRNFASRKSLVAYAGVDPAVDKSGKREALS